MSGHGAEILLPGEEPIIADIIFVHGLGGDRRTTWEKDKVLWPRDLLGKEDSLRQVRVISWGYDAAALNFFDKNSLESLFNHAQNLLVDIKNERAGLDNRPIFFVGHSLGGLVIKQALCKTRVAGDTRAVESLRLGSDTLDVLSDSFSGLQGNYRIYTARESSGMPKIGKIVEDYSSTLSIENEESFHLEGDHSSMCKFASENENGYKRLLKPLVELIEDYTPIQFNESNKLLSTPAPLFRGPRHSIVLPSGEDLELTPQTFGRMVQQLVELEGPDPPHTQAEKMKRVKARHGWKSRNGVYHEAFDALSFNAKSDKSICDLLYISAALDRADIVNALLRSGADPNIMIERVHYDYPLLAALRLESMAAADALLNSNAKVNIVARELGEPVFYTPIGCALQMVNLDLVRRLLKAGAKANSPAGSSPTLLSFCIFTCPRPSGSSSGKLVERVEEWIFDDRKRQIMDVLIRAGSELNFIYDGISLYTFAIMARSVAFTKYLTDNHADFNISDSDGDRPLHQCIWSWVKEDGDAEARDAIESILKHLLDVGASWRAFNEAGISARELVLSLGDKASSIAALFPHTHTLAVQTVNGSIKEVVESDDSFLQSADETVGEVLEAGAELIEKGFHFLGSVFDSDSDSD